MAHQIPDDGTLLPLMEEFYTIQGEGYNTGKAAYFIRLGGCDVGCHWCDVKESWDAELHALTSADQIIENASLHPAKAVVVTGGEPLIYNLDYLTAGLQRRGQALVQNLQLIDADFDLARIELGVRHPLRPPLDFSGHAQHKLGADALGEF